MPRYPFLAFPVLLVACVFPAVAQETTLQVENVRTEYARVMAATPVYQTLHATSMVERCERSTPVAKVEEERRGLARVVGAVRDVLAPDEDDEPRTVNERECRMVPVDREFRRPIAYDVDYVHHGIKYRSRLPFDPGNRLRVRVSVTPIVPANER